MKNFTDKVLEDLKEHLSRIIDAAEVATADVDAFWDEPVEERDLDTGSLDYNLLEIEGGLLDVKDILDPA